MASTASCLPTAQRFAQLRLHDALAELCQLRHDLSWEIKPDNDKRRRSRSLTSRWDLWLIWLLVTLALRITRLRNGSKRLYNEYQTIAIDLARKGCPWLSRQAAQYLRQPQLQLEAYLEIYRCTDDWLDLSELRKIALAIPGDRPTIALRTNQASAYTSIYLVSREEADIQSARAAAKQITSVRSRTWELARIYAATGDQQDLHAARSTYQDGSDDLATQAAGALGAYMVSAENQDILACRSFADQLANDFPKGCMLVNIYHATKAPGDLAAVEKVCAHLDNTKADSVNRQVKNSELFETSVFGTLRNLASAVREQK